MNLRLWWRNTRLAIHHFISTDRWCRHHDIDEWQTAECGLAEERMCNTCGRIESRPL